MVEVRIRKLLGDVRSEPWRVLLMVLALAVSLLAVGSVLGAYAILTREIAVNYLQTRPASATLELPAGVDSNLVQQLRANPRLAEVEARDVVLARARVGAEFRPVLLFVIDDFSSLRLNTFRSEAGAWPPALGTLLIERSAQGMLGATIGESVAIKTPNGKLVPMQVSGLVHDPGLAPAWQEREGYGYITRATLAWLGEAPLLHELRVRFGNEGSQLAAEANATQLARELAATGHSVEEIRVPPLHQHPHQRQMTTILVLMLTFSMLSLLLSAVLVASSLSALFARQVREIGVLKTIGAKSSQIATLYFSFVAGIGLLAFALALPLGVAAARGFSSAVAAMLNFRLTSVALPYWVFAVQVGAGVLVPTLVAAVPIFNATRITARQALDQYGVSTDTIRERYAALPRPLRNVLRRPTRLALTLTLLAAGGAMFMTALDVSRSWQKNIAQIYETRKYDLELRLHEAQPLALASRLAALPGVRRAEAWGYAPAAFAAPGQLEVVHTYPDRGHGSMAVLAPPPDTELVRFPVRAGRWLVDTDTDKVVLNHVAQAQAKGAKVGDRVWLSINGQSTSWVVAGVVEEIGAAGVAYVTDAAFRRVTATEGRARLLRIATDRGSTSERAETLRRLDRTLSEAGIGIDVATPLTELRTAVGDHIVILIRALLAMAVIMATVGALGLGGAMSTSVLERTREFGVMKALGATPGHISRLVLAESGYVTGLSVCLAVFGSIPLTYGVDRLLGNLGFLAPLPLVIALHPALQWLVIAATVTLATTWLPARQAGRLTVREALAQN